MSFATDEDKPNFIVYVRSHFPPYIMSLDHPSHRIRNAIRSCVLVVIRSLSLSLWTRICLTFFFSNAFFSVCGYAHKQQAHCRGKTIKIFCGKNPSQNVRWLANVAIARLDTRHFQGWKLNGIPVAVSTSPPPSSSQQQQQRTATSKRAASADPSALRLDDIIGDVLQSGDHVYVKTSMDS